MTRPLPPDETTLPQWLPAFAPALELGAWAEQTFIAEDGPLYNPDHRHLIGASIGWLWASNVATSRGRTILGEARMVSPQTAKWSQQMTQWQLIGWFGDVPDMLITISAGFAQVCDDASFCALVEHELYHLGHKHNAEGEPMFSQLTGNPVIELRGHDVEEFVGVVERYGVVDGNMARLKAALDAGPSVNKAKIATACGTCQLRMVA